MAVIVSEFFGIIGVSQTAPATMSELIPWLMQIIVGLCLVCGVFGLIGNLMSLLLSSLRKS